MASKALLKAALNVYELANNLENISTDDGKEIADYTDAEILAEARYVKGCFEESGHALNEALHSSESRREALRGYRAVVKFINRFSKETVNA